MTHAPDADAPETDEPDAARPSVPYVYYIVYRATRESAPTGDRRVENSTNVTAAAPLTTPAHIAEIRTSIIAAARELGITLTDVTVTFIFLLSSPDRPAAA